MKVQHIATSSVLGVAAAATVFTVGAGTASAEPAGVSAIETTARLQAEGNRVITSRVGAGPLEQCSVVSVSPVTTTPLPTGNPLTGVPNLQRQNTVHLSLKC